MLNITNQTTHLHQKFYNNIRYLCKNYKLHSVIVAISGGQDSLCLIKLLQDFKKVYIHTLNIDYIYIDHQWKKDSKQQIEHLVNLINCMNEKIYIYQINNNITSETNARTARYQLLTHHSVYSRTPIIMTAHTLNDTIETFINQVIRGTGIDGATSLTIYRILESNIQIWRPLINFTRIEINWLCRKYYLPIWSDITNYSYYIYRNRIRNELLPYLKQYFQQNIEIQINKFLDSSRIDNEYIKQNAIKLYLISRHNKNIAINYTLIKKQHISLIIRTLQIFLYHNLNIKINYHLIRELIHKLNKITENKTKIACCNIYLYIYYNWIYIC